MEENYFHVSEDPNSCVRIRKKESHGGEMMFALVQQKG